MRSAHRRSLLVFFLRIRRPPRSTLFPTRRSSDLSAGGTSGCSSLSPEPGCWLIAHLRLWSAVIVPCTAAGTGPSPSTSGAHRKRHGQCDDSPHERSHSGGGQIGRAHV